MKKRKITRKKPNRRLSKSRKRTIRTRKTKRRKTKTKIKKPTKKRKGNIIKGGVKSPIFNITTQSQAKKFLNSKNSSIFDNVLLTEVKQYIDCNFKHNYSDELKATLLRKKEELIKKLTNIDDTVKSYKKSLYELLQDNIRTSFNSINLTLRPPELKLYYEHLKKYSDYIYRVEKFGNLDEYKENSMRLLNTYYNNKMTQYNIQKHTLEKNIKQHETFKENPTSIEARENDETRMDTLPQQITILNKKKIELEEKEREIKKEIRELKKKFYTFLEDIRIFFNTYYLKDKNLTDANITKFKTKFEKHREILISLVEQSFSRCTSVEVR